MVFELKKSAAMTWLDMPDGVRLHVRPYTSIIETQAEKWAVDRIADLEQGADALELLGLFVGDDAIDPDKLAKLFRDGGIAVHAIAAWEGVTVDGVAAEATAANIWQWMMDPVNRVSFLSIYDASYREARLEGNGSGPLPNGISEVALNIADPATTMTSPVQGEGADTMESSAPTDSIAP